jgi:hypothetical protein
MTEGLKSKAAESKQEAGCQKRMKVTPDARNPKPFNITLLSKTLPERQSKKT